MEAKAEYSKLRLLIAGCAKTSPSDADVIVPAISFSRFTFEAID
jgi:hypothetical protein